MEFINWRFQNIDVAARVYAIFGLEMVNGSTSRVSTKGKCIYNKLILNLKLNSYMIHFKNLNLMKRNNYLANPYVYFYNALCIF